MLLKIYITQEHTAGKNCPMVGLSLTEQCSLNQLLGACLHVELGNEEVLGQLDKVLKWKTYISDKLDKLTTLTHDVRT